MTVVCELFTVINCNILQWSQLEQSEQQQIWYWIIIKDVLSRICKDLLTTDVTDKSRQEMLVFLNW
jgi:hypothetical protein